MRPEKRQLTAWDGPRRQPLMWRGHGRRARRAARPAAGGPGPPALSRPGPPRGRGPAPTLPPPQHRAGAK
jgi:hypothetical protein